MKPRPRRDAYAAYKRLLWKRAQGRCERPECGEMAHDPHHVKKPRGSHHPYILSLCRSCHEWVDAPTLGKRGRLYIELAEHSREDPVLIFTFRIVGGPQDGWEKSAVLPALRP